MSKQVFNYRFFARVFVFAWFFIGGILHYARPDLFLRIVPPYIPYAETVVYISGVFELLGAFGLWVKQVRGLAGYGLMLLTLAVTPANIYMLQHSDIFSAVPYWVLVVRLPFQLLLLWIIWWCSRNVEANINERTN